MISKIEKLPTKDGWWREIGNQTDKAAVQRKKQE